MTFDAGHDSIPMICGEFLSRLANQYMKFPGGVQPADQA
jgi:hypothetical protein